jgi:spoIIIJ-associated protein
MDQAEASGKTVEDALNAALRKVGARREEVEFTVLDEGKRGGLFGRGAKDALVRVTRLAPQDRVAGLSGPPDTRIPRQGQRGGGAGTGQRGRDGGQRPPRGAGGTERGQRAGAGRSTGFEQAQPKLTDADFVRGSAGAPTGRPPREGAPRRGRGGAAGAPDSAGGEPRSPRPDRADRPPRADRPDRPARPPRERSQRDSEPPIEPDINAVEVDYAATIVDDLLRIFDIETEISIREPLTPGDGLGSVLAVIDIKGEDLGLLIGRRGDTLIALQYLVNLMLGRKYPGRGGVTIDVEHYKHRNEERIMNMAQRMGDRVRETGNSITLEPMSAAERRLVHVLFADDAELETNSVGEGENRKVVISLK